MAALDAAPDPEDARLRLRAAIRRVVESVWLLVVRRGSLWLCAVQVYFRGDGHRDYLIHYQPAGNSRPGGWSAHSRADLARLGDVDLRKPEDAAALQPPLETLDLARVMGE
jgi:hypothetical protein